MSLHRRTLLIYLIVILAASHFCLIGLAQSQAEQTQSEKPANVQQEMSTQETAPVFRVRVNQVLLKVVVRDAKGNAVKDLRKEDFEIKDNGKPQRIASFSSQEKTGATPATQTEAAPTVPEIETSPAPIKMPERYVAYLIDDLHIETAELLRLKIATERHLAALPAGDRVAVFTTSGRGQVDFTQDREALLSAIRKVQISFSEKVTSDCPWMTYYFADLIWNKEDKEATDLGVDQTIKCMQLKPEDWPVALQNLKATARQALTTGDYTNRLSLLAIQAVAKRMSVLPGQRIVVMVSPGYLVLTDEMWEMFDSIDRALRADVVVNTLDVRGLYTDANFDASLRLPAIPKFQEYVRDSYTLQGDVLATIAHGTGGTWFHNNNDLELGLQRTAGVPEVAYTIAFSPSDLKFDGSFHKLKVAINRPGSYTVFTKPGYRAPAKSLQAKEAAEQEIEETFFSREEQQAIPLGVTTQYFKSGADSAVLDVVAHVSVQQLPFRKAEDRNLNTVVVVAGIFDPNGRYIEGTQKTIDFRLKDETLQKQLRSGISLKSRFKVKPGGYLIRVLVRDSEGQLVSAKNSSVEIPWE